MLKLKLHYFGHLMQKVNPLEKTQMLGKIKVGRRKGWQRIRWLDGITYSTDMSLSKVGDGQGGLACCSPWGHKESDTTERLNWTPFRLTNSDNKGIKQRKRPSLDLQFEIRVCARICLHAKLLFEGHKLKSLWMKSGYLEGVSQPGASFCSLQRTTTPQPQLLPLMKVTWLFRERPQGQILLCNLQMFEGGGAISLNSDNKQGRQDETQRHNLNFTSK